MTPSHQVLLTGSAGAIGRVVGPGLAAHGHHVRGFDRVPSPAVAEAAVGDLTDPAAVRAAMAGADTVIHLAAEPDDCDFMTRLLPANVVGLYHVFDAARTLGVRRLILASSVQAISGHETNGRTVRVEDGPRPRNHYGLTKVWAEEMGRFYAARFGMVALAVRIGWFPRNVRECRRIVDRGYQDGVLTHDDAVRFFRCAVEAELPAGAFGILFGVSRQRPTPRYDPEPARRLIGYEPQDAFPEGCRFDEPFP